MKFIYLFIKYINKILPKGNKALIMGSGDSAVLESNAVELANYIKDNQENIKVYFASNNGCRPYVYKHLHKGIHFVAYRSFSHIWYLCTSRYIFSTYGSLLRRFSKKQVFVNIWHGVGHKRIGKSLNANEKGLYADITVGTSEMTKKIYAKSFDVPEDSVYISGYPRNDLMIRTAESDREALLQKLDIKSYDKVLIWLPTYRVDVTGYVAADGEDADNPFQITGFDIPAFDDILIRHNSLCLVKPHPKSRLEFDFPYRNVRLIGDTWLMENGLSLYQLLGCTDALITDYSSVMVDYLLLNRPVICFSSDFETYKKSRGFNFEDIESMTPSQVLQKQEDFFNFLEQCFFKGKDPDRSKREKIRDLYFSFLDDQSTKRLVDFVFSN